MKNKLYNLSIVIISLLVVSFLFSSCDPTVKPNEKIDNALINHDFSEAHKHLMEIERISGWDGGESYYASLEKVYSAELAWLVENGNWDQAYFILLNLPKHHEDDCGFGNECKNKQLQLFKKLREYAVELDNEEMVKRVDKKLESLENE